MFNAKAIRKMSIWHLGNLICSWMRRRRVERTRDPLDQALWWPAQWNFECHHPRDCQPKHHPRHYHWPVTPFGQDLWDMYKGSKPTHTSPLAVLQIFRYLCDNHVLCWLGSNRRWWRDVGSGLAGCWWTSNCERRLARPFVLLVRLMWIKLLISNSIILLIHININVLILVYLNCWKCLTA